MTFWWEHLPIWQVLVIMFVVPFALLAVSGGVIEIVLYFQRRGNR